MFTFFYIFRVRTKKSINIFMTSRPSSDREMLMNFLVRTRKISKKVKIFKNIIYFIFLLNFISNPCKFQGATPHIVVLTTIFVLGPPDFGES